MIIFINLLFQDICEKLQHFIEPLFDQIKSFSEDYKIQNFRYFSTEYIQDVILFKFVFKSN